MTPKEKLAALVGAGCCAALLAYVPRFEGTEATAYRDPVGILTVCVGHTGADIVPGKRYTREECEQILVSDLLKHAEPVLKCTPGLVDHPLQLAATLKAPVLGLYGAADTGISVASVERMKTALSQAGVQGNAAAKACQFVMYPDTPHAFHADYRPSYTPGPAVDGWNRAIAWMKQHV